MKQHIYRVPIYIFITLVYTTGCNLPAAIQQLRQAVATYSQKHLPEQRTAVIQALQKTPYAALKKHPELVYHTAGPLTQCRHVDSPLFAHKELIDSSIAQFAAHPGYPITLHTLLTRHEEDSFYKGYTYELHAARMLYQRYGIKVIAFGVYLYNRQGLLRQFDLQTPHSLIECKNILWPKRDRCDVTRMDQQFLDQRCLVDDLNAQQGGRYAYEVCSNDPILDGWREFFAQHRIATRQISMP